MVATYDYINAGGELVFQVVRYDPKDFRQRRPDGNGGWTQASYDDQYEKVDGEWRVAASEVTYGLAHDD